MKIRFCSVLLIALLSGKSLCGAALGSGANAVIPAQIQQIISIDYRSLRNSGSGIALKDRVMPADLRKFEFALKDMGVDTDRDISQLAFVSFRDVKGSIQMVGIAQGEFSARSIVMRMRIKKVRAERYRSADLYPAGGSIAMSFLDTNTVLFGNRVAVHSSLDARDGQIERLSSSSRVAEMMSDCDGSAMWSVLDQAGTQYAVRSSLGAAGTLADYDSVKKRLLGSCYTIDFSSGLKFNFNVVTSDSLTAASMAALIKAGMMYQRLNGDSVEKAAIDSVSVESDSGRVLMRFQTEDAKLRSLLASRLFSQVLR